MVENDEFYSLIDRYFDAATTSAEERRLRLEVARRWAAGCREPALCEVAAVMGFGRSAPVATVESPRRRSLRLWRQAAAAVVVLAAGAGWWLSQQAAPAQSSYIVAGGHVAGGETEALSLMAEQLAEISAADRTLACDVESQITDLGRSLHLSTQPQE